jgi:hypothetical protein
MTPKPKPKNYSKILDVLNTPQAAKTFSPKTYIDLVGQYSRKAFDNGEISKKEYMSIVKPLFGDAGIMASDKIKKYKDELNKYANGGRIGFLDGGDTKYNAMVTEMYIKLGGEEGTGMDIDSFAKEYFKQFNQGGRVGLRYGGDTMGGINDKSISSPGPDRSKVSEQQERNNQAAVREAQAFNQKKEETINRIKRVGSIPNTPPSIAKFLGLSKGIRSLNPFDNYYFQDAITRAEQMISPDDAMNQYDIETPETDFFSGPAYNKYNEVRTDAYANAPSKFDYDIRANEAAGQFIQDQITGSLGDNKLGRFVGDAAALASVPFAIFGSPFHEAAQVVSENRMEPGSGITGFAKAFMNEQPISTAINRGAGVLQSTALGKGIYNLGENLYNLKETTLRPNFATGGRIRYSEGSPDIEELRKRVEELMDDGETFGDAVKIAVKELENG